jgi:ComF family protein
MGLQIVERLLELLYPPRCVICQELVPPGAWTCGRCEGNPADLAALAGVIAGSGVDRAGALFAYGEPISKAIFAMKSYRDRRMLSYYSDALAAFVRQHWPEGICDLATCVPTSTRLKRQRGFNHAAALGKAVAERLALPFSPSLLTRENAAQHQRQLGREERLRNALESYHLHHQADVAGRRILLIDDVFTTGATAHACAHCLKAAGAVSVSVLTICYTPPRT